MEIDPSMAYSPLYKGISLFLTWTVILVGESNVGKTSFLSMYVKGICNQTIPTIAVEFCTKEFKVFDGSLVKVQLWDTAGQERFKSMGMKYFIILIYIVIIEKLLEFYLCSMWLSRAVLMLVYNT